MAYNQFAVESLKAEMIADKKFVEMLIESYNSYKEEIPSIEHRPVLPQRIFSLLTYLTPLKGNSIFVHFFLSGPISLTRVKQTLAR